MNNFPKKPLALISSIALCCSLCPAAALAQEAADADAAPAAASAISTTLTTNAARESLATLYKEGALKVSLAKSKDFTGKAIKPKPTLKLNGIKLEKGIDYTVIYKDTDGKTVTPKAPGVYRAVIKGKGAYKGSATRAFSIIDPSSTGKTSVFNRCFVTKRAIESAAKGIAGQQVSRIVIGSKARKIKARVFENIPSVRALDIKSMKLAKKSAIKDCLAGSNIKIVRIYKTAKGASYKKALAVRNAFRKYGGKSDVMVYVVV